jgi:hypothetical protein
MDYSDVQTSIGQESFQGLPDANDFSKHKDFYVYYLWTYCSGHISNQTSAYNIDFCAKSGTKSLYNLYRYWSVWGAQVHKEGTRFLWLEHVPDGLYMAYLFAAFLAATVLVTGRRTLSSGHVSGMTVFLSALSFSSTLATAAAAHFTFGQLIQRASDPEINARGHKQGHTVYMLNWVSTLLAFVSFALWSHLSASNTIRRAPTLDTRNLSKGYEVAGTTGAESPILDSATSAKPTRRRTLLSNGSS